MKKKIYQKLFSCLFCSLFLLCFFSSCQDEIFYLIDKEVELNDTDVPGDINNMTRLTTATDDYLYVQNGKLLFKSALPSRDTSVTNGAWVDYPLFGVEGKVYNVVSDSKYIYIMTSVWDDDEDINDDNEQIEIRRHIYYCEGVKEGSVTSWKEVGMPSGCSLLPFLGLTDTIYSSMIFANNARGADGKSNENAKAFVRLYDMAKDTGTSLLSGGWTVMALNAGEIEEVSDCANEASAQTSCAFFVNGKTYFSTQTCAIVNYEGVVFQPIPYTYEDGTVALGVDTDALSLATVGKYVIAGTSGGVERFYWDNGVLSKREFQNNAETALTEYYRVTVMFALEPNRGSDMETDMYAAITFHSTSGSKKQNHVCLWACYSIKGKWNRE